MNQSITPAAKVAVRWECLSNLAGDEQFTARMVLRNVSPGAIAPGWALYFNTARRVLAGSVAAGFRITHVNGDLMKLEREVQGEKAAWLPGEALDVTYAAQFWAISVTDAPLGLILVEADGQVLDLGDPDIAPFSRPEQRRRNAQDRVPTLDAAGRWRDNAAVSLLPLAQVGRITPTPLLARFTDAVCRLGADSDIVAKGGGADSALNGETAFLRALLGGLPRHAGAARIVLEIGPVDAAGPEAYRLDIGLDLVTVRGASAHGVFNGIQTLAQLLDDDGGLPCGHVLDGPRFGYRGMMLDVARHFAARDTVLRLLDCMARYKLNRLHLHLTDDEGWRLHIDALPELTAIGARRGIGADCLPPSFGSGAAVDASSGSGFYDAADFIAILRYAQARHIEVIPEFNMPGHARAAVVAMRARAERLRAQGDDEGAARYLLSDPDDVSVYESVQLWRDNVMCIALDSCERFIDVVVGHVAALYRAAGAPLRTIHTGGDEVPAGAWEGSPRCQAAMRVRGWTDVGQLHADFLARCRAVLARHGVAFAGWDETAQVHEHGHEHKHEHDAADDGSRFQVYAWNNAWGLGNEDVACKLANAGYDVVLANAAYLYFDLAHAKEPHEPGYYWAGFVDTRDAFAFCPIGMHAGAANDAFGRPVPPARLAALTPLTPAGRARILGLQGQLWAENARSRAHLEYLAAPRLVALAERAWAPDPGWCAIHDDGARAAAIAVDWNGFANRLGQRVLPGLDRAPLAYGYRLPPPGAVVENGLLQANIALPGLALHYTLDGSEPHAASPRYSTPISPPADAVAFKVAAFDTRGRKSRTVTVKLN